MEELDILLSQLKPFLLYFIKFDPKIDKIINDEIQKDYFKINKEDYFIHEAKLEESMRILFNKSLIVIAEVKRPEVFIQTLLNRIIINKEDILIFKEKVLTDNYPFDCRFLSAKDFLEVDDEYGTSVGSKYYSQLEEQYKIWCNEYLEFSIDIIERVEKYFRDFQISSKTEANSKDTTITSSNNKIKLNLSVGEIALLFRLLFENKTVESESKEELFRAINSSFESSKQDSISVNSLRKKYHETDSKSLSDIDALLVNLRQILKKIQ